jgi:hypothetical protein
LPDWGGPFDINGVKGWECAVHIRDDGLRYALVMRNTREESRFTRYDTDVANDVEKCFETDDLSRKNQVFCE